MAWWDTLPSYELQDFLMFSPAVYFRMVEGYVSLYWPLAALFAMAFAGALYLWRKRGTDWPVWAFLAAAWLVPVPLFFLNRYGEIMSAAPAFAGLFALQGALLLIAKAQPAQSNPPAPPLQTWLGYGLLAFAIALYPLVAGFAGRSWGAAEPTALMPDPAVPLTLGWFLLVNERRFLLWCGPILWAAVSALTLHTMGEPDYWLPPGLVSIATIQHFLPHRRP